MAPISLPEGVAWWNHPPKRCAAPGTFRQVQNAGAGPEFNAWQSWFFLRSGNVCNAHGVCTCLFIWLVVSTPLKNISHLGWCFPIYGKKMFQTTNQLSTNSRISWFYFILLYVRTISRCMSACAFSFALAAWAGHCAQNVWAIYIHIHHICSCVYLYLTHMAAMGMSPLVLQ